MFSRSSFLAAGAAASAMLLLSGCGAANNAINNAIPSISNLLNLDGQPTDTTVGAGRALISGSGTREVQFDDRSLSQANRLNFVKFTQNLAPTVTVSVPSGATLPPQFVLTNIELTLNLRDEAPRSVSVSKSSSGPVTFVRTSADSNEYTASDKITFADFEIKGGSPFDTFRDIVTSSPSPNFASAHVAFDADDTQLPSGTVLSFQTVDGKAKIGL